MESDKKNDAKLDGLDNPIFHYGDTTNPNNNGTIVSVNPQTAISKYGPKESRRMNKNVILIGLGFLLLFTCYNTVSSLQSSINSDGGAGVYSLSTVYGGLIISSLFLPTIAIRKLTSKWTIVISMVGYTFYTMAQFYPTFGTLIPTAFIVGISASTLWSSKCFYLTQVGHELSTMKSKNSDVVISAFFSTFFALFQSSVIWGNIMSSLILNTGENNNITDISKCGASFCPGDEKDSEENITDDVRRRVNILCGILLACAFAAILLVAFLVDPLSRYGETERQQKNELKDAQRDVDPNSLIARYPSMRLLISTVKHMRKPYQILIIPLTIFSGLEQGFLGADYTQAYITCSWGVDKVGFVLIAAGVCDSIMSYAFGWIIRYTGRIPIYTLGAFINIAVIICWHLWKPDPDQAILFYVFAAAWGTADAVWQTQINALYGICFPGDEEPAFSNYRLWESIGFIFAYANSNLLCNRVKLHILSVFLIIGMIGYYMVEILLRRNNKLANKVKNPNT